MDETPQTPPPAKFASPGQPTTPTDVRDVYVHWRDVTWWRHNNTYLQSASMGRPRRLVSLYFAFHCHIALHPRTKRSNFWAIIGEIPHYRSCQQTFCRSHDWWLTFPTKHNIVRLQYTTKVFTQHFWSSLCVSPDGCLNLHCAVHGLRIKARLNAVAWTALAIHNGNHQTLYSECNKKKTVAENIIFNTE